VDNVKGVCRKLLAIKVRVGYNNNRFFMKLRWREIVVDLSFQFQSYEYDMRL
jgi:hypothetical protein